MLAVVAIWRNCWLYAQHERGRFGNRLQKIRKRGRLFLGLFLENVIVDDEQSLDVANPLGQVVDGLLEIACRGLLD